MFSKLIFNLITKNIVQLITMFCFCVLTIYKYITTRIKEWSIYITCSNNYKIILTKLNINLYMKYIIYIIFIKHTYTNITIYEYKKYKGKQKIHCFYVSIQAVHYIIISRILVNKITTAFCCITSCS